MKWKIKSDIKLGVLGTQSHSEFIKNQLSLDKVVHVCFNLSRASSDMGGDGGEVQRVRNLKVGM